MSFLSLQEFLEDLVNLQGQNLLLFWGENKEKVFDCLLTSVTWPSYFVKMYSIIIEGIPDVCVTIFYKIPENLEEDWGSIWAKYYAVLITRLSTVESVS